MDSTSASIPFAERVLQLGIDFPAHGYKLLARGFQLRKVGLFERHVELENFLEEFGRNVFRGLLPDIEALEF